MQRLAELIIFGLVAIGLGACGGGESGGGESPSAGKAALEDAGQVANDAGASSGAAGAAGVAVAAAGEPDLAAGEATYGRFCFSCHAAGLSGAPKTGSAEDWAPRAAKGLDALVATTIAGVPPAMPPRGLCSSCSDQDLRNAVAWMIAQ